MDASTSDARQHLQKLRIDKEQRPTPRAWTGGAARPRRRTGPVIVLVLLVLGGAGYVIRERYGSQIQDVIAATPEVRLVSVTVQQGTTTPAVHTATGKIVSDHRVRVATKVSGQITELMFEQGDRVKRGQVIAKIEDVAYLARRDNLKAKYEQQKAKLVYSKASADRVERLYRETNAPEIEFIQSKSEYEAALAQYSADEAALREAQWELEWCKVTAPVTGVVLDRSVEVGDFVSAQGGFGGMANAQFATIADMTQLRVEVDVSELDITKIFKDMPCVVIPDAYKDRRYAGHVLWIDPEANFSKGTVQVKVRIDNPDDYLRVEGSARVDFKKEAEDASADRTKATLWLPRSAVLSGADAKTGVVLVFSDDRLHRANVTLGRQTERLFEIVEGVSAGARVADEPSNLKDGQRAKAPGA